MALSKILPASTTVNLSSNRNIAYNGAMNISQRSTSVTGIGAAGGLFTLDRFPIQPNGTAGRLTMTQTSVTDLAGFQNCLKLDCTTADTSVAAAEFLLLGQYFEGQDLQRLKKGTSSAEPVTLSFYVKGNAAATYTAELYDADNNRSISRRFSVTTSWNRVSLTYVPDTTGAFDDDNASSLIINIWLHAGSDYTSGTQNTVWKTLTQTERANSSDTSFFDSTNRTFFMTGFQFEIGEAASAFEYEDIGTTLRKCQRYTQILGPLNLPKMRELDRHRTNSYQFPVVMRAAPTFPSLATTDGQTVTLQLIGTAGANATTVVPTDGHGAGVNGGPIITAEL